MRVKLSFYAMTSPMEARERKSAWQRIRRMCECTQMADLALCKPVGRGVYMLDEPEYDLVAADGGPGDESDRAACERQARHDTAKRFANDAALASGHTMRFEILPD